MKRQHPIAIMRYITKNFWLLLIPLIRGIAVILTDFTSWLSGAYWDLIVLAVILGLAVFRWFFVRYEISSDYITIQSGFFVRTKFSVPFSAISSVTARRSMLLRPIRGVKLLIDTDSHSVINKSGEPDAMLIIRASEYHALFAKLQEEGTSAKLIYRASPARLFIFSILFSSSLSGIIYVGTLFIQGGRLITDELEKQFVSAVNDVTSFAGRIINGVTPAVVGIMLVIAAGWLFSFISNYLRYIRFRVTRRGDTISVHSGFFSKWHHRINAGKINYADLRQNLLMKLCRVTSVHISCSGYGKEKNSIPVFVPITLRKRVLGVMKLLLPEYELNPPEYCPHWDYIMRFIGVPLTLIFAVMAAGFILIMIIPGWYPLIFFVCVMGEIISFHLLFVQFMAYYTNGISFKDGIFNLSYCRLLQFHNVIAPLDKIVSVKIEQTFFQRMNNACDIVVYTKSESFRSHKVVGLYLDDARRVLGEAGFFKNEYEGKLERSAIE